MLIGRRRSGYRSLGSAAFDWSSAVPSAPPPRGAVRGGVSPGMALQRLRAFSSVGWGFPGPDPASAHTTATAAREGAAAASLLLLLLLLVLLVLLRLAKPSALSSRPSKGKRPWLNRPW